MPASTNGQMRRRRRGATNAATAAAGGPSAGATFDCKTPVGAGGSVATGTGATGTGAPHALQNRLVAASGAPHSEHFIDVPLFSLRSPQTVQVRPGRRRSPQRERGL